jgi:Na+/proline symporter
MEVTLWPLITFTVVFLVMVAIGAWASQGNDAEDDSKP